MSASNGERLQEALDAVSADITIHYHGTREGHAGAKAERLDQIVTEYDRATAEKIVDLETCIESCSIALDNAGVTSSLFADDLHGERPATLPERIVALASDRDGQAHLKLLAARRLHDLETENIALRERLAKLEAATTEESSVVQAPHK